MSKERSDLVKTIGKDRQVTRILKRIAIFRGGRFVVDIPTITTIIDERNINEFWKDWHTAENAVKSSRNNGQPLTTIEEKFRLAVEAWKQTIGADQPLIDNQFVTKVKKVLKRELRKQREPIN